MTRCNPEIIDFIEKADICTILIKRYEQLLDSSLITITKYFSDKINFITKREKGTFLDTSAENHYI